MCSCINLIIATIPVMADSSSLAPDPVSEEYNVTGIEHSGSSFIVIASSASTGIMNIVFWPGKTAVASYIDVGIG